MSLDTPEVLGDGELLEKRNKRKEDTGVPMDQTEMTTADLAAAEEARINAQPPPARARDPRAEAILKRNEERRRL